MPALNYSTAPDTEPQHRLCLGIRGEDRALRRVLSELGHQCVLVDDALQSAQGAGAARLVAVFQDLSLSTTKSTGRCALLTPGTPALIYTAGSEGVAERLAALRGGGMGLLARPYQPDETDRLIRLATQRADAARTLRRLVIVEDDRSMARLVAGYLGQKGYQVKHVEDPLQLLEALASFRPDALILDLNMPDVSGAELAAIVRQFPTFTTLPILFLSGETDIATQIDALRCGADGFLSKPIRAEELLGRIDAVLARLDELDHLAHRDPLTGLPNRRAFLLELELALASAHRTQRPVCLAIIDVDHFKSINDAFGHITGDRVLRRLATHLQASLRREDFVGRIGGEEFAIILPGADLDAATAVLDAARAGCTRAFGGMLPIASGSIGPRSVSFSGGLVRIDDFDSESSADLLLERADEALYRAKAAGRNRVERA